MTVAWNPVFSIRKVRNTLPSFVPPPGFYSSIPDKGQPNGVTNYGGDTIPLIPLYANAGRTANDVTRMFSSWGKRVYCSGYGTQGAVAVASGDHAGLTTAITSILLFDIGALTWRMVCVPGVGHPDSGYPGDTSGTTPATTLGQYGEWSDGCLSWGHTYGYPVYFPPSINGTTQGEFGVPCQLWGTGTNPLGASSIFPHAMDLSVSPSEVFGNPNGGTDPQNRPLRGMRRGPATMNVGGEAGSAGCGAVYDPVRKGVWCDGNGLSFLDATTLSLTVYSSHVGTDWLFPLYYPTDDLILRIANSGNGSTPLAAGTQFQAKPASTPAAAWSLVNMVDQSGLASLSRMVIAVPSYNLFQWSSILGCFVAIDWGNRWPNGVSACPVGSGSATVLKFIPPPVGQGLTGTWTMRSEVLQGWNSLTRVADPTVNVDMQNTNDWGEFGNFAEVPALRCFIRVNMFTPPQLFRLQGM